MGTITIGADPELFLSFRGELRSSVGKVGGTKDFPRPLDRPGFFVQEDNVAVEFNIPPASTVEQWVESLQWSLTHIKEKVIPKGTELTIEASGMFPDAELRSHQAISFGCTPDYCAWTNARNPKPDIWENPNLRSCGGHVHIGWENPKQPERLALIKAMDLFLGVPSVTMDMDQQRRKLYGLAGAFRITPYGTEYRTLSNFWLKSPELMRWVFEQTTRAFDFVTNPKNWDLLDLEGEEIRDTINNTIPDKALRLVKDYRLVIV